MKNKKQDSNPQNIEPYLPYKYCLNCDSELKGMYCHNCGQMATSKTPTVMEFILEYLNNAFIWDTKFFQTLWYLIRRPGYLTREYLSGKFVSQEHPLKLNMFLLFVFITLFVFFAGSEKVSDSVQDLTTIRFELMTSSLPRKCSAYWATSAKVATRKGLEPSTSSVTG